VAVNRVFSPGAEKDPFRVNVFSPPGYLLDLHSLFGLSCKTLQDGNQSILEYKKEI
jgi:hypothetical protein